MTYAMVRPNICYQPDYISEQDYCYAIFQELQQYPFQQIEINVYGRLYTPLRKLCAFADPEVVYTFSGATLKPHPWTPLLLELKTRLEKDTGYEYNYVLANYYESGKAKIGQHKDSEKSLDTSVPIITLSFGATRTMIFTKRGIKSVYQPLQSGSRLDMFDQDWSHAIHADSSIKEPRISLTFRKIHTIADLPMAHNQEALDDLPIQEKKRGMKRLKFTENTSSKKKKCVKTSVSNDELSVPTTTPSEPNLPPIPVVNGLNSSECSIPTTSVHPYDPDGSLMKALDAWDNEYKVSPSLQTDEKISQPETQNPLNEWNLLADTLPHLSEEMMDSWNQECDLILGETTEKPLVVEKPFKDISMKICEIGRQEKIWLKSNTAIYVHCENAVLSVRIYDHECGRTLSSFQPTERGICMDLPTYYDFARKIQHFSESLSYPSENTIFGDNVLALVQDKKLRLQNFTQTSMGSGFVCLDRKQLKHLKESVHAINGLIEHCLFDQLLKHLVGVDKPGNMEGKDQNIGYLRFLIEKDLTPTINKLYFCEGCASQKYDLNLHYCLEKSISQKYSRLMHPVVNLCDVHAVAKAFLEKHEKLYVGERDFIGVADNLFKPTD